VAVKRDYQLTEEDFQDQNLILSLGGDGTFLKTASMVTSNRLPILGVNTDPTRSVGHLCSRKIPFDTRVEETARMIKLLNHETFEFKHRSRLLFKMKQPITGVVM